jgi:hypothetical protein
MTDTTDKALDALQSLIRHNIQWAGLQDVDREAYQQADDTITALRRERDALRAQLATARADAMREAATLCGNLAHTLSGLPTGSPHSQDSVEVIASGIGVAQKAVLSLIDTPTPSAPSPEAVARAALEWAANCIECGCRVGVCEYPAKCPENDVAELVDAASDHATIAAIITKAGGGE